MFKRVILICAVVGFLLWIVFADYLRGLWIIDRDQFWIVLSVAGFILFFSSFWMVLSARLNEIEFNINEAEFEPCKTCGSTSREFGPNKTGAYCPHCGEPDSDFWC